MGSAFLRFCCVLLAPSGCSAVVSEGDSLAAGGAGGEGGTAIRPEAGEGPGGAPTDLGCECLPWAVSWRRDGGLVASQASSSIEPCGSFRHEVQPWDDARGTSCSSPLAVGCDEALGVRDINRALQHPDVRAARAAAPVLYGGDPRGVDGQVDRVEVDGKLIEIGVSCGDPLCDIPPGIEDFRYILGAVAEHELATDCHLAELK